MANELTVGSSTNLAALLEPARLSPLWLTRSVGALGDGFRPTIPAAFALTDPQRAWVEEAHARLEPRLAPASVAEIGKWCAVLQAQFETAEKDPDIAAARAEGLLIALEGVPLFALQEAVRRIMQDRAGLDRRFMPKGPELRALVDEIAQPARAYRVQLRRLLDARVETSSRLGGPRALPPEVSALLARPEGERVRRRHPPNPSGVDHSAPYHFAVRGE